MKSKTKTTKVFLDTNKAGACENGHRPLLFRGKKCPVCRERDFAKHEAILAAEKLKKAEAAIADLRAIINTWD